MAKISTIDEDSENYGLWAKSGLPLVFLNKVLLEYSQTHSCVGSGSFLVTIAELRGYNRAVSHKV